MDYHFRIYYITKDTQSIRKIKERFNTTVSVNGESRPMKMVLHSFGKLKREVLLRLEILRNCNIMEEQIKKSFKSAFRNVLESLDEARTKEEIAQMFFELGWKAGVENENSSIDAAISVLKNMKKS